MFLLCVSLGAQRSPGRPSLWLNFKSHSGVKVKVTNSDNWDIRAERWRSWFGPSGAVRRLTLADCVGSAVMTDPITHFWRRPVHVQQSSGLERSDSGEFLEMQSGSEEDSKWKHGPDQGKYLDVDKKKPFPQRAKRYSLILLAALSVLSKESLFLSLDIFTATWSTSHTGAASRHVSVFKASTSSKICWKSRVSIKSSTGGHFKPNPPHTHSKGLRGSSSHELEGTWRHLLCT